MPEHKILEILLVTVRAAPRGPSPSADIFTLFCWPTSYLKCLLGLPTHDQHLLPTLLVVIFDHIFCVKRHADPRVRGADTANKFLPSPAVQYKYQTFIVQAPTHYQTL